MPKIFSWEDFLLELYIHLVDKPKILLPESAKTMVFLQAVPWLNKLWKEPEKLLHWSSLFLEVFEEFEKEGRIPENLLYPPEELPDQAKEVFEDLKNTYQAYKSYQSMGNFTFLSEIYSELNAYLQKETPTPTFIKGLYLAGFVALREVEKKILSYLIEKLQSLSIPIYFFFESFDPPPRLIGETIAKLELIPKIIPSDFLEREKLEPKIHLISFPDTESQIQKIESLLSESTLNSPDEIAIILPQPTTLLPLLFRLQNFNFPINITLPFPSRILPLSKWIILILKAQRERKNNSYPTSLFKKIFTFPLLKALFRQKGTMKDLMEKVRLVLSKKRSLYITKEEILKELENHYHPHFSTLYEILFQNWETIDSPKEIYQALVSLLEFLKPLLKDNKENEELNSLLTVQYVREIEQRILPLFKISYLWENFPENHRNLLISFLENLLLTLELPLYGDPLSGLQILGFLESRLLSFKRIFLLDVNEGALPPPNTLNPLLTDEMKTYLNLPIYRNELWDYYFDRLLNSAEEIFLFYIHTEKGKSDLLGEPSRYIQKLKWLSEIEKKHLKEEAFKLQIYNPQEIEAIPKTDKDVEALYKIATERGLSRNALETYLTCPGKFYFQYLLNLKPQEELLTEEKEIGIFLHQFFQSFFEPYLGKTLRFKESLENIPWKEHFDQLWKSFNFEEKIDPLSAYLGYKIALAGVNKYFQYLLNLEKENEGADYILETQILAIEKRLEISAECPIPPIKEVKFYGIVDLVVKRVSNHGKQTILIKDFKTKPSTNTAPSVLKNSLSASLPQTLDQEALSKVASLFGSNLCNFQLLFYLYLLLKNKTLFPIETQPNRTFYNALYVTPTDFEEPEKELIRNPKIYPQVINFLERNFQEYLFWILRHILEAREFYLNKEKKVCNYCQYEPICKIYRRKERALWERN
ncbi:MAG: PD-(D/E)XK nuclease family protein [Caldimicrobium sp.]|nr:PD-(D/E)XK nuclease family protein [Caldimicrobium sp.]MDW8094265.1 PD-(D/E)XK nuclease family protein [Caldimicrobium sp.]